MACGADQKDLAGLRVLIVEDEYYLADDLANTLRSRGADVVGPVGTLEDAIRALETENLDKAVLDMNLRGEMAFEIADRLEAARVPFVIATGYSADSLPERLRDKPRLEKPFDPDRLAALIAG